MYVDGGNLRQSRTSPRRRGPALWVHTRSNLHAALNSPDVQDRACHWTGRQYKIFSRLTTSREAMGEASPLIWKPGHGSIILSYSMICFTPLMLLSSSARISCLPPLPFILISTCVIMLPRLASIVWLAHSSSLLRICSTN